jgi:hypothetical protein
MYDWIKTNYVEENDQKIYTFDCRGERTSYHSLHACHLAIEKITKEYPPPYTLYLSGGVDSQAMLWAWYTSGVPFQTFSARFENNFNDYDLEHLEIFSKCYNIDINYQTVPILDFFENEHPYYAETYMCGSPQITTHMKLLTYTTEGTCIMSGDLIVRGVGRNTMPRGTPHHNNTAFFHYRDKTKPNFIPFFFLYTKELVYSTKIPKFSFQMPDEYTLKCYMYHLNEYPIIPQSKKYNGFEKIKEYYDEHSPRQVPIIDKLRTGKNRSTRNFDLLYRNKYEAKFKTMVRYNWLWE